MEEHTLHIDAEKFLRKRKRTGKELGRFEVSNALYFYHQAKNGEPQTGYCSLQRVQQMANDLNDPKDEEDYSNYLKVHDWISNQLPYAQARQQEVLYQMLKLYNYLSLSKREEEHFGYYVNMSNDRLNDDKLDMFKEIALEYLIKPETGNPSGNVMLDSLFPESKTYEERWNDLKRARRLIYEDMYFLMGHNLTLDIINETLKIDWTDDVKIEGFIDDRIISFNNMSRQLRELIPSLYKDKILLKVYNDEEIVKKKLHVIDEIFAPIDLSQLKIPEKEIEETRRNIKNFSAFKNSSLDPGVTICIYKEHDE